MNSISLTREVSTVPRGSSGARITFQSCSKLSKGVRSLYPLANQILDADQPWREIITFVSSFFRLGVMLAKKHLCEPAAASTPDGWANESFSPQKDLVSTPWHSLQFTLCASRMNSLLIVSSPSLGAAFSAFSIVFFPPETYQSKVCGVNHSSHCHSSS